MKCEFIRLCARKAIQSVLIFLFLLSCNRLSEPDNDERTEMSPFTMEGLASVFSSLPIEISQIEEVHDAVLASAFNGFDEEYLIEDLINSPGTGVTVSESKAGHRLSLSETSYECPLRKLLSDYLAENYVTKGADVDGLMKALSSSGFQIYWPFSEDWDGESFPTITYDPGYGAESNVGYRMSSVKDVFRVVDTVVVDEAYARLHPVWVINSNDDAGYTPLDFFLPDKTSQSVPDISTASVQRRLILKSFKMLRHYDTIFGGASEFFIKIGSADGFTATTEAELKLYTPSVTDMMIVVRRRYLGVELPYDAILMADFTNEIDKIAFLITEDDGGTKTSWDCEVTVKWNSRSYGFDVNIPYNEKDDIVWRGRLTASFFQEEDEVSGRFGDVVLKFALE